MQLSVIPCHHLPVRDGEAQAPPEVLRLDELTFPQWGKLLSLEQYYWRERVLRAQDFSRAGLRTFVLHEGPLSAPDSVLASCETYAVPIHLGPKRGLSHGIASVFVEEKRRGHGYASELLRRVERVLRDEGATCSYLMSEIGPTIYQRLGYVPRPLYTRRYAAADPRREPHGDPPPWRWLESDALPALLAERYRRPQLPLWLEVTPAQVMWHVERARFYAQVLGKPLSPRIGARAGEAFALWAADYTDGLLRILLLYPGSRLDAAGASFDPRSPEAADLRNVLHAARTHAFFAELPTIEVWENPRNARYLRGGIHAVCEDLPMLLPLAPGVRAEDFTDYERVHWI